jgi:hypothetical protein
MVLDFDMGRSRKLQTHLHHPKLPAWRVIEVGQALQHPRANTIRSANQRFNPVSKDGRITVFAEPAGRR